METTHVHRACNDRPARGHEEGGRIFPAVQRLHGWHRAPFRPPRRHQNPSRARRPRLVGHRPPALPDRNGGPWFHERPRPGEDVMAASATMGPELTLATVLVAFAGVFLICFMKGA